MGGERGVRRWRGAEGSGQGAWSGRQRRQPDLQEAKTASVFRVGGRCGVRTCSLGWGPWSLGPVGAGGPNAGHGSAPPLPLWFQVQTPPFPRILSCFQPGVALDLLWGTL